MRYYRSSPSVYTVAFAFGVGRQAADRLTPSKAEQCGAKNIFIPPPRGALAAAKSRRPLLPMLGRTEGTAAAAAPSKKRRMPEEERADGGAPSGKRRKNVRGDASNASGQAAGQALSPLAVIKRRKGRNLCHPKRFLPSYIYYIYIYISLSLVGELDGGRRKRRVWTKLAFVNHGSQDLVLYVCVCVTQVIRGAFLPNFQCGMCHVVQLHEPKGRH